MLCNAVQARGGWWRCPRQVLALCTARGGSAPSPVFVLCSLLGYLCPLFSVLSYPRHLVGTPWSGLLICSHVMRLYLTTIDISVTVSQC